MRPTPGSGHTLTDCPCGQSHRKAPPVLAGPKNRDTDVGYVLTDTLYQQVEHLPDGWFKVIRTVGYID